MGICPHVHHTRHEVKLLHHPVTVGGDAEVGTIADAPARDLAVEPGLAEELPRVMCVHLRGC